MPLPFRQGEYFTEFEILGEPASKANSRRLVMFKGSLRSIRSSKAVGYADAFQLQCPKRTPLLTQDLFVQIDVWYASRRPDLDESIILDAMQGRIYENDRQVKAKHVYWHLDRTNPRCRIRVCGIGAGAGDDFSKREGPRGQRFQAQA